MATKYWIGNDTGNEGIWDIAANWSPSGVPAAADTIVFDEQAANDVTTGPTGVNDGLQHPLIWIKSDCTINIGDANNRIKTQPSKLIYEGSGTAYFECSDGAAGGTGVIPLLIMNSASGTLYLHSEVSNTSNADKFTDVFAVQGRLNIEYATNGTWLQYLYISPANNSASNVTVTIGKDCQKLVTGATDEITIFMNNGTLTTDSDTKLIVLRNGTLNFGTKGGGGAQIPNIGELRQHGGTLNWYPDGDNAYIGKGYILGGTLDASGSTNDDHAKTLGDGANDIYLFSGANVLLNNGQNNISVASGSTLYNFGATLEVDNNAKIAITYDT